MTEFNPFVNVASHLARLAETEPERPAIIDPRRGGGTLTFRELNNQCDALACGLQSIGIVRGLRTVLMVPPSLDFFTLTFALFKIGAVPVLVDPGMGIRNLGRCLGEAEPEAFIGIPKANLARKVLGWARKTIRITITTGGYFGQHRMKDLRAVGEASLLRRDAPKQNASVTEANETAAILFTSGSTGVAKGVVYTHGIFARQVELLRQVYDIRPGEIDLSTFPLFALFGPALGMTAIVPDMNPTRPADVEPKKIIDAVHRYGVTNLFGSPALINRVGTYGFEHSIKLPTLKRAISAGAPVPAKVIERFATMLNDYVQIHTPYGATEALPVASIGSHELLKETRWATDLGAGVCVGRPVDGVIVRIIPISDDPMPVWDDSRCLGPSEIGEIAVSGPNVTKSYFNRPQANELAKMIDPASGTVWHRLGDVGYLDSLGRIWFCGRKSQRVITSQGTLFTIPCEAVFNTVVYRTALVGVPLDNQIRPVLCVQGFEVKPGVRYSLQQWVETETELRRIALQHPHTQSIATFLQHFSFPVDIRHNAKIFREKLAIWAAKKLRNDSWAEADKSATCPTIAPPPTFDSLLKEKEGKQP